MRTRDVPRMTNDSAALHAAPMKRGMPSPLFFTANGAAMPLEGMYHGAHAFLVLNGPTVAQLPPGTLNGLHVMTVNNGPRTIRGNMNVMLDSPGRFSLSQWLDPTIQKFVPLTHFGCRLFDNRLLDKQRWQWARLRVADCPNVLGFRRNDKFDAARFLYEPSINWGNPPDDGGGRSVMLSSLRILFSLGFRYIYLVGADFKMDAANRYHFEMESDAKSAAGNNHTYAKLNERFTALRPHLERAGCNVWNCTPDSSLTAFAACPLSDALNAAKNEIGDWTQEKTAGMYDEQAKRKLLTPSP